MAGMFYSLQETAQSLSMTEEQVNELVQQGKLREFRDGSNVLFKIDEVKSLMSDTSIMSAKKDVDEAEADTTDKLVDETEADTIDEEEIALVTEEENGEAGLETSFASGLGEEELNDADTAVANEGIDVLGEESSSDYQLTDDIMGETSGGTGSEASLEDIEEDVNLDTFGSGSGLLDLSLQADDTSLGGILDEIYTPEGEEGQDTAAAGGIADVASEAEEMLPEEDFDGAQDAVVAGAGVGVYIEPAPDMQSNAFGIMLFLPLLIVIYTAIVVAASLQGVVPAILTTIQGLIWHIMAGVAVTAILVVGIASMMGGDKTGKPKAKKAKKEKKPKKKKEKKKKKDKKKKKKKGEPEEEDLAIEESELEPIAMDDPIEESEDDQLLPEEDEML